jgi:DNA-binding GntR family transcriptional regulator
MADWQKIKTEYITTDTSYRKLAEKHGVGESTLFARASKEKWVEQKEQYQSETVAKTLDAISGQEVDRATRLQTVADKVLNMVEAYIEASDPTEIDTQSMKHISGVLKDIKEVQRYSKDLDEQDARIAKLRKEAEAEDTQTDVVITFGSEEKRKWAE